MFFKLLFRCLILLSLTAITACMEDLTPSNDPIQNGQSGKALQGSVIDDISLLDNEMKSWQLSQALAEYDAVVFYFTMWCPVCDSHMQHINRQLAKDYPNVAFIFVDYVSTSIAMSRQTQLASGYSASLVIADVDKQLQERLAGSMSSLVIIDKNFVVQYNQVFQSDTDIRSVLDSL